MNKLEYSNQVISLFVAACERLNDYARELRRKPEFKVVETGADLRSYQYGWRMEKWIEALLSEENSVWAVWWFELGFVDEAWLIEAHLSITNGEIFMSLPSKRSVSIDELDRALSEVVDSLASALQLNEPFKDEVGRWLESAS